MTEIRYDAEAIHRVASQLREQAAKLRSDTADGAAAVMRELRAEASRYTRSGDVAPIYRPVVQEADRALDAVVAKASRLADAMDAHADILVAGADGATAVGEDAAAALASIESFDEYGGRRAFRIEDGELTWDTLK